MRSMFHRMIGLVVLFNLPGFSAAQDMMGTLLGNYAGVNSIQLNPSALHNSKTYLDIQLLGLDLFVQNNYLYMQKSDYRFSNFFSSSYTWPTHKEDYGPEVRNFYHYTNKKFKSAFVQTRINGPGAMLIFGKHAIALTTSMRTVASLDRVPYDLANFIYLGLNYVPQQNINYLDHGPIRISSMSWGEIGLSYANNFYARGFNVLSAGITVKRLLGLGGMYLNAKELNYTVVNDSTLDIKNLDAQIGLALPINNTNNTVDMSPLFKGGGFGVDVGVTYTRLMHHHQEQYYNSLCAQPYEDYLYRVGVALVDLGGIRFSHNATLMNIDNRNSYWRNLPHMKFRSIQSLLDTISYKFYGNTTDAMTADHFTLWLPAAVSVQFDYHLKDFWYVNASVIYGFPVARGAMTRPAELAITPRYESGWFEVNMPVSLYNWQLARVGLSMRIYGVTIGTDKLGGFFHMSDFTGLDFYMSLKWSFDKGNCRLKGPVHCGSIERKKIK